MLAKVEVLNIFDCVRLHEPEKGTNPIRQKTPAGHLHKNY